MPQPLRTTKQGSQLEATGRTFRKLSASKRIARDKSGMLFPPLDGVGPLRRLRAPRRRFRPRVLVPTNRLPCVSYVVRVFLGKKTFCFAFSANVNGFRILDDLPH
jgi:hypothetical protein